MDARCGRVGIERHIAVIATHHHLALRGRIVDGHGRDVLGYLESETLAVEADDTALLAAHHPGVPIDIAHTCHLAAYLPLAGLDGPCGFALHDIASHLAIAAHPHIATGIGHEIVDHIVRGHSLDLHGLGIDAVYVVAGRSPHHTLGIGYQLAHMQRREGIGAMVGKMHIGHERSRSRRR